MKIQSVGSTESSGARSVMMELWRMTMTQRVQRDLQQRVSGRTPEPRKVEPAVKVEISDSARYILATQSMEKIRHDA